jgi:ABC-type transport system involved in Fe-S cluster assembly fused permease/ATPase subunit
MSRRPGDDRRLSGLHLSRATEWRIAIRREMNDSDTDANTKAIDSLLNYETVKYFGAEAREAQALRRSMAKYEKASVKTYTSLACSMPGRRRSSPSGMTSAW